MALCSPFRILNMCISAFITFIKNTSVNLGKPCNATGNCQFLIWSILERQIHNCSNAFVQVCAMVINKLCVALLFLVAGETVRRDVWKQFCLSPICDYRLDYKRSIVVINFCLLLPIEFFAGVWNFLRWYSVNN